MGKKKNIEGKNVENPECRTLKMVQMLKDCGDNINAVS